MRLLCDNYMCVFFYNCVFIVHNMDNCLKCLKYRIIIIIILRETYPFCISSKLLLET